MRGGTCRIVWGLEALKKIEAELRCQTARKEAAVRRRLPVLMDEEIGTELRDAWSLEG
jgi:hypothetical protein